MVGQSSPRKSPFRNAQHHLKGRVILLTIETKRGDKMVSVQFSHMLNRGDELWIIFKRQPAFIDSGNWRVDND